MPVVLAAAAALAWLGRQGPRAIAAIVFIAIALPPLDALLKPLVTEAVFALLCLAFLRMDTAALLRHVQRPWLVLAATAWSSLAIPALFGTASLLAHFDRRSPALFLALMLQVVTSPMMGFDATLVLSTLVVSTAITPLSAPLLTYLFVGPALTLSPLALGLKLFAILAGSLLVAVILRRLAGLDAIRRRSEEIDGVNILLLYIFVAAVMENVGRELLAAPATTIALTALAFAVTYAVLAVSTMVFATAGRERAFALGMMTSQRNMGLMLAATGGAVPDFTWLYFALAQFPIYLAPLLLGPLARRIKSRAGTKAV
jgi:hypothetical protein